MEDTNYYPHLINVFSVLDKLPEIVMKDQAKYCTGLTYDSAEIPTYHYTEHATQLLLQKIEYLSELLVKEDKNDIQMHCCDILQFMLPL